MKKMKQHSTFESISLHLIPGAVGTIVYIIITPGLIAKGYPSMLGFLIAALITLLPIEIGILLYAARKENGKSSVWGAVSYRQAIPRWQYVAIPLGLLIWGFLVQGFTGLLDTAIISAFFSWLPEWFFISNLDQFSSLPQSTLMITFFVGLVLNGFVYPFVEELYFRGYLLPRIERFGKWAPVINTILFSLYHFFSPWQFFSRIVWLLPWVYAAWKKRNIYLTIITHCLANTLGWLLVWGMFLGK